MPCTHCGRVILNKGSLKSHELRCSSNPDRIVYPTPSRKGQVPWNKGLTKETSLLVAEMSQKSSETLRNRGGYKRPPASLETREKLRMAALKRGLGGCQEKSGRGKSGRYKGIWCDSSWELAFVIKTQDEGKQISRCQEKRSYFFEGKLKHYYPDFCVDGFIYEVKGWDSREWQAKHKYNPDVVVISKKEIEPILEYVKLNYGKNFTDLYEEKGFKEKLGKSSKSIEVRQEKIEARLQAIKTVDFQSLDWPQVCARILGVTVKTAKSFVKKHVKEIPVSAKKGLPAAVVESRLRLVKDVDFKSFGWVQKVANILGVSHSSARRFINQYYEGITFTRKSPLLLEEVRFPGGMTGLENPPSEN